jgi:hypothetical protein
VYAGYCYTAALANRNYLLATSYAMSLGGASGYNSSLGYTADEFTICPELDEFGHPG